MKAIVVASLRPDVGKTTLIIGLARAAGRPVAYLKPFGDRHRYKKKRVWDSDAALVSLGGDIACGGTAPDGGWLIAIADPFSPTGAPAAHVRIPWGAVATSTTASRRWIGPDGAPNHHLIDPVTHRPADSGVVSVTTISGECWLGEAVAKAAVIAGVDVGLDILERNGVEALVIEHGTTGAAAAQ